MKDIDIIKGVSALKSISVNLNNVLDFINNNKLEALLPYTNEIHNGCVILTDIFENAFNDMISERYRFEDDGK